MSDAAANLSQLRPDTAEAVALNDAVREAWDQNAAFWDERMGEGNQFQRELVGPTTERLLEVQTGERVLDLACGNGVFARRMAQLGAAVVACDFSPQMIAQARQRITPESERIDYRVVDATDETQLRALGAGDFDAAVCSMAFHDIATLDPLMRALRDLLRPGGRFVFSMTHPCFNSGAITRVFEEIDRDGEIVHIASIKVTDYLRPHTYRGLAIDGQPVPHYYFHRTLSQVLSAGFRAGLMVDALDEPSFAPDAVSPSPMSWSNFRGIPPVLVVRLRLP